MASEDWWGDDGSEQLQLARARARQTKLQRCALYSAGSRARLPRTKSPTKSSIFSAEEPAPRPLTAIPPGAHEDTYRVFHPPSALKQASSERLFWTTTSMTEGIRVMPQPPWYYGRDNKVQPSDSDVLNSATRYGYRGSQSIRQFTRSPHARPEHTLTDRTPTFLRRETLERQHSPDVWVPPLEARSSHHRRMPLNSPKLWPETSSFVTGFKAKRPATSAWYRKETTAVSAEPDEASLDPRLTRTIALLDEERDNFTASTHLERSGALLSRPHTMASVFWDATASPPSTSQSYFAPTQQRAQTAAAVPRSATASNIRAAPAPGDQLRYSGTQTIVVQQKPRDQLQYEQETSQHPLAMHLRLRWQNIFIAHRALTKAMKRDRDTRAQVMKLAAQMRLQAKKTAVPTLLSKAQFMRTLNSFGLFHLMTNKQRNWLFSVFDAAKHSMIRFVEMIAMFGVLDAPHQTVPATLQWLWELYETFGRDQSPLENAQTIYLTCCYDKQDRQTGLNKFNDVRTECYRRIATMTVRQTLDAHVSERDTAVPSQFNMCDNSLSFHVFMEVLNKQPASLQFFADTLNNRRAQYAQYLLSVSGS